MEGAAFRNSRLIARSRGRGARQVRFVVEALDRLSRRLSDVATFHDRLAFRGQKLFACDRGEIFPLLVGILGAVAQSFLEDLKTKTKRGLRGKRVNGKRSIRRISESLMMNSGTG
jgi:DNA invertase Pin-like site-specific DNA recombinase